VLREAQAAYKREIDRHTLADFLPHAPALLRLWRTKPPAPRRGSTLDQP
jgi:hypothetical protein